MTKADVFFIIAQIYIVGGFVAKKETSWLAFGSWAWFILSFIAWAAA